MKIVKIEYSTEDGLANLTSSVDITFSIPKHVLRGFTMISEEESSARLLEYLCELMKEVQDVANGEHPILQQAMQQEIGKQIGEMYPSNRSVKAMQQQQEQARQRLNVIYAQMRKKYP